MNLESAEGLDPPLLHQAFVEAFADYLIGPFKVPLEGWPQLLARQAVDLSLSRVVLQAGQVLAFAYAAPRPEVRRWRVAAMGALPAARGSGAARLLLDDFLQRAAAAGQQAVELEVFAQNERAARLYLGRGFVARHELHGYRLGSARFDGPVAAVRPVAAEAAWSWLREVMAVQPELPLQVTPAVLQVLPPGWQAWQHGTAQLVFNGDAPAPLVLHSLVDRQPAQQDAQRLVEALLNRHTGREVVVPQLQRPDLGGEALRRLGFEPMPLHQLWMRCDLRV